MSRQGFTFPNHPQPPNLRVPPQLCNSDPWGPLGGTYLGQKNLGLRLLTKRWAPKTDHNLPKKSYLYPEYTLEMTPQKPKGKCIIYNKVMLLDATTLVFIFTSLCRGFLGIMFSRREVRTNRKKIRNRAFSPHPTSHYMPRVYTNTNV